MTTITFADKSTGDQLTAADVNEIKTAVNANAADKYKEVEIDIMNTTNDTTNPPSSSYFEGYPVKHFAQTDKVFFSLPIPLDYKEGTDLKPYVKMAFNVGFTSQVYELEFTMGYRFSDADSSIAASDSTTGYLNAFTTETKLTLQKLYFDDISGAGKTVGGHLFGYFEVNTNDTPDYLNIFSIGFAYVVDSIGSTSATAK